MPDRTGQPFPSREGPRQSLRPLWAPTHFRVNSAINYVCPITPTVARHAVPPAPQPQWRGSRSSPCSPARRCSPITYPHLPGPTGPRPRLAGHPEPPARSKRSRMVRRAFGTRSPTRWNLPCQAQAQAPRQPQRLRRPLPRRPRTSSRRRHGPGPPPLRGRRHRAGRPHHRAGAPHPGTAQYRAASSLTPSPAMGRQRHRALLPTRRRRRRRSPNPRPQRSGQHHGHRVAPGSSAPRNCWVRPEDKGRRAKAMGRPSPAGWRLIAPGPFSRCRSRRTRGTRPARTRHR